MISFVNRKRTAKTVLLFWSKQHKSCPQLRAKDRASILWQYEILTRSNLFGYSIRFAKKPSKKQMEAVQTIAHLHHWNKHKKNIKKELIKIAKGKA